MKARLSPPFLIFYAVTALMLLISAVCFIGALSWFNKPFAGFLIYDPPYVDSLGITDWPGKKAGLVYLDRIVKVDGEPVIEGRDVVQAVRQKGPDTLVTYEVESKGQFREVTVRSSVFGFRDFFLVFFITFSCGVILYFLGFIVFLLKPNITSSWVFLGLCFSLGTYVVTAFECESTYIFPWLNGCSLSFFPATFFHLGLVFPDRKRFLNRFPALEYLIYLPASILALLCIIYFSSFKDIMGSNALPWMPGYRELGAMCRVFSLFCAISLFLFVLYDMFRASTTAARQRARMILFGVTIAFVPPGIIMATVQFLKVNIPWNFLVFFVIFFPASIAYSIVRHNLFDADVIIRRTVGYMIVTAVVIGAYVGVSVSLNVFAGKYQLAQSRAFPILFTLGIILLFNPLRDRIQLVVDRIFFRREYDYGEIIEKISEATSSLLDLGQILKRLIQTFMEDMFLNTSSIMLLTADGAEYKVFLADGEGKTNLENMALKRNSPLMEIIEDKRNELTKFDLIEDPKYSQYSEKTVLDIEALNASLIVPLVFRDQVIGSLNLGEKKSGKPYNREDIELFRTLAHQGAVAIENARLFQENLEKQRMEDELNIARDLQMSMLPATCPEIKGFEIAASSSPAMEVGGDFFDFIETGKDRVGFVVGDVTGKSVSGALVMSASRSVFRMLSEEHLSVGEIMKRANRRTKKDIKAGMFVALLYAVLDAKDKKLSLCSAGQTLPIHLSNKTGKACLMEAEGDTFPLGIIDDADYQETCLQLAVSDRVVFYTDGIVEAMNEQAEIFGFERLIEVVQAAKSMNAESLLKEIIEKVNDFAGGAAQHDDLTVIVVSVND